MADLLPPIERTHPPTFPPVERIVVPPPSQFDPPRPEPKGSQGTGEVAPTPALPDLRLKEYLGEVLDYFSDTQEDLNTATAKLIEKHSGGKVKAELVEEFEAKKKLSQFYEKALGFIPTQVFNRIVVSHPAGAGEEASARDFADQYRASVEAGREREIAAIRGPTLVAIAVGGAAPLVTTETEETLIPRVAPQIVREFILAGTNTDVTGESFIANPVRGGPTQTVFVDLPPRFSALAGAAPSLSARINAEEGTGGGVPGLVVTADP